MINEPRIEWTTLNVQGHELDKQFYEKSRTELIRRASFDLECPEGELSSTILDVGIDADWRRIMTQVGVSGCGRRAAYMRAKGTWIANLVSTSGSH